MNRRLVDSSFHAGRFAIFLGLVVASFFPARAQAATCFEPAGRWPYGPALAVDVDANYAYFGKGAVLVVADKNTPATLGEVFLPGVVTAVAVSGSYAYVAADDSGLCVIDISAPSAPVMVGQTVPPLWLYDVAVSGSYAYVGTNGGLYIYDISDPTLPVQIGTFIVSDDYRGIAVSGSYAYAAGNDRLSIIDISDPTTPVEVGYVLTPERIPGVYEIARDVAVSGSYAYLGVEYQGLRVIDISDPSSPIEVGSVKWPPWTCLGVAVSGSYAYVSGGGVFTVIDVSTPTSPKHVSGLALPDWGEDLVASGSCAFVADSSGGLRYIDVSNPSSPVETGSVGEHDYSYDVAVSGSFAYVADYRLGLRVLDVSDPLAPVEVASELSPYGAFCVAISGSYAYVGTGSNTLWVVDISVPTMPMAVGQVNVGALAFRVTVSGSYAYVATLGAGLRIIDASDPTKPVEKGYWDNPPGVAAYGVDVSGSYAYVASGNRSLRVLDVSDPTSPVEVGYVNLPNGAAGVAVSGPYAYVVAHWMGMHVVDISDPTAPVHVGTFPQGNRSRGIDVSGSCAYIANGNHGFEVVDVSDPRNPVSLGRLNGPGDDYGVAVAGAYAYVAEASAGVEIFDISNCCNVPPECDAGADIAGAECDGVQLNATATDANSNPLTISWTSTCGAGFSPDPTVLDPVVTFGSNCAVACDLTLNVDDGRGGVCTDDIHVELDDKTPPVLSGVPGDTTVECDAVPAPAAPTASDNCDKNPAVTFNETRKDGGCADTYTLTRTWTTKDTCGNTATGTQVITVQDTQPPVLSGVPADMTVECDAVPAPATPTATDNCDKNPAVTFNETRKDGGCADTYTLTRTWTTKDTCGNTATGTQVITVQDTQPPVLSGVPADMTVECDAVPAPAAPTATDNCDAIPAILFSEKRQDGSCPYDYALTRTWTAVDACDNKTTRSHVVTVRDTMAPELSHEFEQVFDDEDEEVDGLFRIRYSGKDNCDSAPEVKGYLNVHGNDETCDDENPDFIGVPVDDGDLVKLNCKKDVECLVAGDEDSHKKSDGRPVPVIEITGPAVQLTAVGVDVCANEAVAEDILRCPDPDGCISAMTLQNNLGVEKTFYWWEFTHGKVEFEVAGESGELKTNCSRCLRPGDKAGTLVIACIQAGAKMAKKCNVPEDYFSKTCP